MGTFDEAITRSLYARRESLKRFLPFFSLDNIGTSGSVCGKLMANIPSERRRVSCAEVVYNSGCS